MKIFLARDILPTWDKQIQSLCYQVNQIIEKISNIESNWMTRAMDEQMVH
jgi:COP9 signalosome complex subunit 4